MLSSPRINGYTHHAIKHTEEMQYDESKYFTPTKSRPEWMRTVYSTPPLPAAPPPSPACWQSPKCNSRLQYSPMASPSLSYCQSQCLQRQNTPMLTSEPGYLAGQYNQSQNKTMSPPNAGYYGGQYSQHLNSRQSPNSGCQSYGLCDQYRNSMSHPTSAGYQHNFSCLQQSALNPGYQHTLHSPYSHHQYAGTQQIPRMTSSYWSSEQYPLPYQYLDPAPPASGDYGYASEHPLQCHRTPEIPVDSPAQHAPENNTLITPVSSIQDLDKIIRDFETGYSSPRKRDNVSPVGAGKFVKKMVAALEQKYSAQTSKSFPETKSRHNSSKGSKDSTQKSFNETFTSRKSSEKSISVFNNPQQSSPAPGMNDTFILEDECNYDMEIESEVQPAPDPDPDPSESEPEPEPEHKQEPEPQQIQQSRPTYLNTDVVIRKKRAPEPPVRSDSFRMPSAPKIVAAKLKKPIEFDDDTEIEWIPVKNQKLPRKNSFKKLLNLLTGKKNEVKGSKFFCNLNKSNAETKSSQRDSGYVEKTSSSSSLSSEGSTKIQAAEPSSEDLRVMSRQHSSLSTFQQPYEDHIENWIGHPLEENNNNDNTIASDKLINKNRMVLEEIDRADLRLSLGPFYPIQSKNIFTDIKRKLKENSTRLSNPNPSKKLKDLTNNSLISSFTSNSFKTPFTSPQIFKSPFSSPKSKSKRNSQEEQELDNSYKSFEITSDLPSPIWEFPSSSNSNSTSTYEYPKNDWSQSEPHIFNATENEVQRSMMPDYDEMIYDVPRSCTPGRPKSSIYEDALSVKRRTESFDSRPTTAVDFFVPQTEPTNFATIRSRPRVLSSQRILRSMAQDESNQLRSPYLVNSVRR